jgi:hypothetical protein
VPLLEYLALFVQRGGQPLDSRNLVFRGLGRDVRRLAPLKPGDSFQLRGEFRQPTYWYVLWFDTAGAVTVSESSRGRQQGVVFPADPATPFVTVNEADPPGVHLVLLGAGSLPPEAAADRLLAQLRGTGKPPLEEPPQAGYLLRGPGEKVAAPPSWPVAYLDRIQSRMPRDLEAVHALFFQTVK